MVLIIKHIDIEGPGSMEEFLRNTTWQLREVDLSKGDLLPKSFEHLEAIISLGGPMNVYEEDKYPFLKEEDGFLKKALKEEIPILGICLGGQLLAKAAGAKVKKAQDKEIGWCEINLTKDGKQDQLFKYLPGELNVFQWHEDTFDIPKGAIRLAESKDCPNQAFRLGSNAYGIQFHIEVTPQMLEAWINRYAKDGLGDILIEAYQKREAFRRQADLIYLNLARIIDAFKKTAVT